MSLPPGFRFHPTDVELIMYYLKRKVMGKKIRIEAISEINIYKFSPWDLPDMSCLKSKDLEWFFFCPRERKYASGERMNRATDSGYWKTTGKDRSVLYEEKTVGMVKTLVFHLGPAPRGERTDWVIHEYRINDQQLTDAGIPQDTYVLCKVFKKNGPGPKNGAQYGAPFKEEEWDDDDDETQVSFQTSLFGIQSANGASTSASPPIPALLAEIPSCSLAISGVSPPPPPAEAPTDVALLDNDDEITRLLASFTPDQIDNTEMLMLPSCLSDSNEIWNNLGEVGGTWGELGDNGLSIADYGCNEDAFLELNDLTRPLNTWGVANPNPNENIQMMNMEGFNQYQYQYGGSSIGTGYLNDMLQMQQGSANTGYSFSDEGGVNVNNGGNQMYCTTNTSSTPAYDMENTTIDPPAGYGGMDPTTGFQNFQ